MSGGEETRVRGAGALLRRTLRRQRRRLVGAVALISVWQLSEAAVPVLLGVLIDRAVASGDPGQLLLWSLVLCAHFAVLSSSYRFGSRWANRAKLVEEHRLRTEIADHVLDARGVRTERLPGEVLSIATADAEIVATAVWQVALTTAAVLGLLAAGGILAVIDPLLAVVVLGGVPLTLVLTRLLAPALARASGARQESLGLATARAADLLRGLRPLQGIGGQDVALARYRVLSRRAAGDGVRAARWEGALHGLTGGLALAFLAAVAWLAGTRALAGEIGVGELIAVVGLAQFVAEPMALIAHLVGQWARSRVSAERVADLLAAPPRVLAGTQSPPTGVRREPALHVTGLLHGSLEGLDLDVRPGALVALVCSEPTEAADLLEVLRAEARPAQGRVRLGEHELVDLEVAARRDLLLVSAHAADVIGASVREAVDPHGVLDDDAVLAALRDAAADDLLGVEGGDLDRPLLAYGATLSGGQRQRLLLARALAADPGVLVLHDPTTAVDAVTEQRIADGLRRARTQGATLVLASAPALLAAADEVVVLRSGRVARRGTHADLIAHADYRAEVLR
ncbi:ABC transporter ATP-binding protein [Alteromonas gracilis]